MYTILHCRWSENIIPEDSTRISIFYMWPLVYMVMINSTFKLNDTIKVHFMEPQDLTLHLKDIKFWDFFFRVGSTWFCFIFDRFSFHVSFYVPGCSCSEKCLEKFRCIDAAALLHNGSRTELLSASFLHRIVVYSSVTRWISSGSTHVPLNNLSKPLQNNI